MDCSKVGKLICSLRKEKNMTQKALAAAMNISDRTISKWERGLGCPDVSLLNELSNILGVNIEKILAGDLERKAKDSGNIRRIKFYVCPSCGNILQSTGEGDFSCCGRKLFALTAKPEDEHHSAHIEVIEDEYYVTINHEMSKAHYISFIAYVMSDRMLFIKLYPEQNAELRLPRMHSGKIYVYCSEHGLWTKSIKR